MPTHLEINPELAARLETAAKSRGLTVRDFVEEALRQRVAETPEPVSNPPAPYVLKTFDFGVHLESPWTVLADLESQEFTSKEPRK